MTISDAASVCRHRLIIMSSLEWTDGKHSVPRRILGEVQNSLQIGGETTGEVEDRRPDLSGRYVYKYNRSCVQDSQIHFEVMRNHRLSQSIIVLR